MPIIDNRYGQFDPQTQSTLGNQYSIAEAGLIQQAAPPPKQNPAVSKIQRRVGELQAILANYLTYQQDRVNERDHHGAWDVAVNLSETECEIAGLEYALKAIEDAK